MTQIPGTLSGQPETDESQRKLTSTVSHARMIFYHYEKQIFEPANLKFSPDSSFDVFRLKTGMVDKDIASVSVTKSIRRASGNFDVEIMPTQNWKKFIAPGDWVILYLYNGPSESVDPQDPPNKDIVMIGNVDRVSRTRQREEQSDRITVRYHISGRDFGKVLEESDLFYNPYTAKTSSTVLLNALLTARGIPFVGSPDQIILSALRVFLSSGSSSIKEGLLKGESFDPVNQWILPKQLVKVITAGLPFVSQSEPHFGDVVNYRITEDLPGFKQRAMLQTNTNGSLWNFLQSQSNRMVNEIFLDLDRDEDGRVSPALYLRPRPTSYRFGTQNTNLTDLMKFQSLQDLANSGNVIQIQNSDIKFDNLGKSDRERLNMIWMTPRQTSDSYINEFANVNTHGFGSVGLPMLEGESIQRYGLRRFDTNLDYIYDNSAGKNVVSVELYKAFLFQVHDLHRFNHLYESGTIETVGRHAQLGKVLEHVPSLSVLAPKIYYIEGYTHKWTFPNKWTTNWVVTMGQFNDPETPFIDETNEDFGVPDTDFENSYLAKTDVDDGSQQGSFGGPLGPFEGLF